MTSFRSLSFLRRALWLDAAGSAAMGLGLLIFTDLHVAALALPAPLLREAGILLLPFAALVGLLASRSEPPAAAVWAVIATNITWIVASGMLLLGEWATPNALGHAFVIGQAAVTALFADLEYLGLKKSRPARLAR